MPPIERPGQREPLGRRFWSLWTGQALSAMGSTAQSLALPLWILHTTGSALLTGAAFTAQALPKILLSPWAGVLADRFDRRNLAVMVNVLSAVLVVAMLPVIAYRALALYYLLTALLATVGTVNSAATLSLVPSLVPRARLAAANALDELAVGTSLALGPLLGASIAVTLGFSGAVVLNAASFLLAALFILPVGRQGRPGTPERNPLSALRVGLGALIGDRVLRLAVLAEAGIFLCIGGLPQIAVVLIGAGGRTEAAGLFSSGLGFGWLLASLSIARRRNTVNPTMMLATGAAAAAPMTALLALGADHAPVWVFFCGVLAGAHNLLFAMAPSLLCQQRAPQAMLGRVFAFRRSVAVAAQVSSLVLMTVAAHSVHPAWVLAVGGVAATLLALPPSVLALRRARTECAGKTAAPALCPAG